MSGDGTHVQTYQMDNHLFVALAVFAATTTVGYWVSGRLSPLVIALAGGLLSVAVAIGSSVVGKTATPASRVTVHNSGQFDVRNNSIVGNAVGGDLNVGSPHDDDARA